MENVQFFVKDNLSRMERRETSVDWMEEKEEVRWKATVVDSSLNKVFSEWGAENNVAEGEKRQEVKGKEIEIEIDRDRQRKR